LKVGVASKKLSRPTLDEISIRGLGVIDSAAVSFSPGFTAITGETGAGKTMVLTALGLITGMKADADFVRTSADRSVVSAQFTINSDITQAVEDAGGLVDDGILTISRSVTPEGKSRITLGGALSTVSKVQDIAGYLIEIHGQSSSHRLSKPSVQRELLDGYGNLGSDLDSYQTAFMAHEEMTVRVAQLKKELASSDALIQSLKDFASDFSAIMPESGELAEIENHINRLGSVEDIHLQLSTALNILESDDGGVLSSVKSAKKSIDVLAGKDKELDRHVERFSEIVFNFQDLVSELLGYLARLEADPARFEFLQLRKQAINNLIKKYGKGSDKEIAFENLILDYANTESRLSDLDGGEERIEQLEVERKSLFAQMRKSAEILSKSRSEAAERMGKAVTAELAALSMPNACVSVNVQTPDDNDVRNYHSHGVDEVSFLFAPHTGSKLASLAKIASGGEMSRLMLAIEVVIAAKAPVGTYVFDEVDAGVGGKAAVEVGRRLAVLAKNAQVIVVTHLPQVAVWADNHLVVVKDQSGSITESSVVKLKKEERLREIARMLAGQEDSQTAQKHAEELFEMVSKSVIS
jgi:DNA repair protein RecN (Recombination protein N)